MHWHIILTEKCNSQCRYCYEKSLKEFDNKLSEKFKFDFSDPCFSEVDVLKLKEFISKDKNPVIVFYGGEPLLNIKKIKEIIENIKVPFRMQTNGKLLNELPTEYLNKIGKVLVSLDGNKERTDFNRGEGTYDKVIGNLKTAREKSYFGEFVGRMTISQEFPDIYEQVLNLVELVDQGILSSIHFQLDVGFYESDFDKEKIKNFFGEYNKSLEKLINWWVEKLKKGKMYKIYPFIGIIKPLLKGKKMGLRCGAGKEGYAITTSGKVVACPIMNSIESFKAGDLNSKNLKKFDCSAECGNCEFYNLCGGRCIYWRKAKLWPEEGDKLICDSIKFYIEKLKERLYEIKKLISEGKLNKKDFDYEDYFGPEIIP